MTSSVDVVCVIFGRLDFVVLRGVAATRGELSVELYAILRNPPIATGKESNVYHRHHQQQQLTAREPSTS